MFSLPCAASEFFPLVYERVLSVSFSLSLCVCVCVNSLSRLPAPKTHRHLPLKSPRTLALR
jgi:hypothetical protein